MVANGLVRVAALADTHVPDRVDSIHPRLLDALNAWKVSMILHAGDISSPGVLDALRQVAPVQAAFGNRDFAFINRLPLVRHVQVNGVSIALMHGHGGWRRYFWDKWIYLRRGYQFERYQKLLLRAAQGAQVVVFGHTHRVENVTVGGQLLFNPGSASFGFKRGMLPSFGILEIRGEVVRGSIVSLQGYEVSGGTWKESAHIRDS